MSATLNTMNLNDADKNYQDLSGTASTIARQLCLAGIAFIWLLALEGKAPKPPIHLPNDLLTIGIALVVTLAFDFLQYVAGAALWGGFRRLKERKINAGKAEPEFQAPSWINRPALTFFWLKIAGVLVSYVLLGIALSSRIT